MRLYFAVPFAALFAVPADAADHQVNDLTEISLSLGSNSVESFAPDGRPGIVAVGWRDNGNAHGYKLYLVLLPAVPGSQDWNVVSILANEPDAVPKDTIADEPHTSEDAVRSVRFARGSLDGERATLLITATRAVPDSGSLADRSAVTYEIYSLQRATEPVGETADVFKRVLVRLSAKQYCNSDMALSKEFGLPLPNDYRGPSTADGCPN